MSRCFPFPPPGYEKQTKTDDVDLLKKEKHREKKHKKEKKDKEKKESKENREKDRSEGKDREKKDRKEKHRDKKKDKEDRDKDKDKSSTSNEKKHTGKSEGHNGEIPGQKEGREKGKSSSSNEKRFSGKFVGDNGEKLSQNSHLPEETKDSKFVQELGRRIIDGDSGAGNQSAAEKFVGTDRKKDESVVRLVAKDIGKWAEGKEKNKDEKGDDRRMDGQGSRDEAESSGNTMLHNLPGFVQGKFEGIPRPLEKNIERKIEGKDKRKKKEGDDKRGDKRRDKDREKKSHGKDKNRDKEKKKEEKVKEKSEQKSAEQDIFKGDDKNDLISSHSNKMSDISKDSDMAAAMEGNLRKRKDLEANGFFHATDIRPNKLPCPPSHSSHPLVENGRVLEPCQTPMKFTSDRQGAASNHIVDKKKQKVNGVIEGHSVSASSMKPASGTEEAVKIAKAPMKPPHPDSKYLGEILSVPKMEEWSDFDDQEWLLGSNETLLKKPKVGVSGVNETPQVWEEAVQIDSVDVCALPYVIPY